MISRSVLAKIIVGHRHISANFHPSTGRLRIIDNKAVVETIPAPDSWIALASVNTASGWGTRPASADLEVFLERYIASRPRDS
jgi:hypothetical protein